jgi:hypothetical protein
MKKTNSIEEKQEEIIPTFFFAEHEGFEILQSELQEMNELQTLAEQEKIKSLNDLESIKLMSEIEDIEDAQIAIFEFDQIEDYQNFLDTHPHGEKLSGYDSEILKWHFNLLNQEESLEFYKIPIRDIFYTDISVLIFFEYDIIGLITIWYIGDTIEDSYLIGDCLSDAHCSYIIDKWIRSGNTAYNLYSIWS